MSKQVTIEGINALCKKVSMDSLALKKRIREGKVSEAEMEVLADCAQRECVRLAEDIVHYCNNEILHHITLSSLTAPFVAAAFATTAEIILGLLDNENAGTRASTMGMYTGTCEVLKEALKVVSVRAPAEGLTEDE